jgi:hypothetical protein
VGRDSASMGGGLMAARSPMGSQDLGLLMLDGRSFPAALRARDLLDAGGHLCVVRAHEVGHVHAGVLAL